MVKEKALSICGEVAMFRFRSCFLGEQELRARYLCRDAAFQAGRFQPPENCSAFWHGCESIRWCESIISQRCCNKCVRHSCWRLLRAFLSASVQPFADQANIPEGLNHKQILASHPMNRQPGEEISSPDWSAGLMLHLPHLRPRLDVCSESLLSQLEARTAAVSSQTSCISARPLSCRLFVAALENESSLARSCRISYLLFSLCSNLM